MTIEERAKEYADRHKATEINYFGLREHDIDWFIIKKLDNGKGND